MLRQPGSDDALLDAITDDVNRAHALLTQEDTPYNRRAFVRSVFAAIEGMLYVLRYDILNEVEAGAYKIVPGEWCILREESPNVDEKGQTRGSTRSVPIKSMLLFTLRHYAQMYEVTYKVDKQLPGWIAFDRSIKKRNLITHPKNPQDFCVHDQDVRDAEEAYRWFDRVFSEVSTLVTQTLQKRNTDLQNSAAALQAEMTRLTKIKP